MANEGQPEVEEGRPCLEPTQLTTKEKVKKRCTKGLSILKVCVLANVGLLTALIYLIAETKVGVELTEKLLRGATAYALNVSREERETSPHDGLLLLAQLLKNLTLSK